MTEILLSFLIIAIMAVGSYYAAYRYVELRHNRDMLADELKRATDHIGELEARVMMLEAERDSEMTRIEKYHQKPEGYDVFNIRS
ncbi:hypothetical protein H7B90_23605 [Cohnella xylanilytica]|uniref:Uncharacterized protein n=1 Tax=Cohnella xylanilytica TaxID=557555 RepID=A0A841U0S8_9BACL|nr:hypothetical protein [Cohnella xylanilytica]MBB6694387.1 hypothetical protein [Cohnella xylanilytica]